MNICAFSKYKVSFKHEYSYISDYELGEPTYVTEGEQWKKEMDGGGLMTIVAKLMLDKETISVVSKENIVFITEFRPNGTGSDIVIKYEEIEEIEE